MARLDVGDRVLHQRERPEPEQVHLHEAEILDVALVELDDVAVGHRRALDRDRVHERQRGDEHAAVVDREMPREVGDRERKLPEEREPRALLLVEDLDEVRHRVGHRARLLPAVLGRAIGVVIRGVLRRRRYASRVDVVLIDRLRHPVDRLQAKAERLRDLA